MLTDDTILAALRRDGIARVPFMPAYQINQIVAHLERFPVTNAHVSAKASATAASPGHAADWPMFCHAMADVVAAPHLLERAVALYPTAREYFDGEAPRLYSMNAFWTQPSPAQYLDTHGWHRDGDDRKQLVMFVYGTDVLEVGGAHRYQRGTHRIADADLGRDFRDPRDVQTVVGSRGATFLADTGGLHMGERPTTGRRLLLWARWGVSDPPASYVQDRLSPVPKELIGERYPADPVLREAIKLVVG